MTKSAPTVWTDVDLVPAARAVLAAASVVLTHRTNGSRDGLELAYAIIAGSLLPGDAALFARAPRLQVFVRSGIGHDRVNLADATAAGVCAANTPEAPTESTAEFAFTLLLAVARRLVNGARPLAAGQWNQGAELIGRDLAGQTLGLVGCGRIGRRVAELAAAFRMTVQAFDPVVAELPAGVRRAPNLAALLATSDVISLHAPHTSGTHHLLDAREFTACKPGVLVINTARGPLINEAALLDALRSGQVAGAGLDVWDPEPPAADSPLLGHPHVVATPHIAAFTREGRQRSHLAAVQAVLCVLRGERPASLLNPDVWPRRRQGSG